MKPNKTDLVTAGNIAKELGISDAIKPDAKKGVCNYYAKGNVEKIKGALKKYG